MLHKIKYKLFLSYGVVIFALILVSAVAYGISRNTIKNSATESHQNTLSLISQNVDAELAGILRLYDLIYNSSAIRGYINQIKLESQPYQRHYQYVKLHHAMEDFIATIFTDSNQYEILIYTEDDGVLYYSWTNNEPDPQALASSLESLEWGSGKYAVQSRESFNSQMRGAEYLYFFMPLTNVYNQSVDCYVVAGVREDYLRSLYGVLTTEGGNLFLMDSSGRILSSSGSALPERVAGREAGYWTAHENGREMITIHSPLASLDWKIVQQIPTSTILQELNRWSLVMIMGMALLIGLIALLCIYLAGRFSRPINLLCEEMQQVESGNMEIVPQVVSADEIGVLSGQFYKMVGRIKALNQQRLNEEKQRYRLEIEALQAQINPHFMYNTINSIKMLLRFCRMDQADSALTALVDILRSTIGKADAATSLEEEVKTLRSYVYIQQIRHCPFRFEVHLPPDLKEHRMLRFILQPVVENSLFHGYDEIDESVRIVLSFTALRQEGLLEITLTDNGRGIDLQRLDEVLQKGAKASRLSGIGIPNIVDRIRLTYGPPCGVWFVNQDGTGTKVTIHLPLLKGDEKAGSDNPD